MATVKFNDVDEFCEELARDGPDRDIVRLTYLFKTSRLSPNIRHVLVVATCTVQGQIVRLERYVGDVWGLSATDEEVMEKALQTKNRLHERCKKLNLNVRAGVLEDQ